MKKTLLLLLTITLQFSIVNSQDFPGTDAEILFGAEIKVKELKPDLQKYGYRDFYKDKELKKIYSKTSGHYSSKYESLVNKTFVVIAVDTIDVNSIRADYRLTLKNEEIGIIYYKYEGIYGHFYPFEVAGELNYPQGFLCDKIEVEKDKFTNRVTYRTPLENLDEAIIISRVREKDAVRTYMMIRVLALTVNVNEKGVILLLSNGDKIEKPETNVRLNVYDADRYVYSAFVPLNNDDIEKLIQNEITDVRLFIHDREIKNGKRYQEYLKCIVEK